MIQNGENIMFEFYRKLKGHIFGNTTVNVKGWLRLHNTHDELYGLNQFYDVETNTLYLDKLQNHLIASNIRYLDKNYYEKHAQDNWNYLKEIMYERGNYKELFELQKENAVLRIDLKSVENSKENYQNKIHDKNCKILSLENQVNHLRKTNHSLTIYQQLYENILKVNQNLHDQICDYSKNDLNNSEKINDLRHVLNEKEKELNNLQKDFNLFVYEYQKLKCIKEDFAETYDEYINKLRGSISFDLGGEQNIEELKLSYEKLISELKRKNNQLTESYEKLSSEKYSKVQRLQKENKSFMISLREKIQKLMN